MAKITTLQKVGIAVVLVSLLVGGIGTVICVYLSFSALETAENIGIGGVGDQIKNALIFSVGGLVGCLVGLALLIVGRSSH